MKEKYWHIRRAAPDRELLPSPHGGITLCLLEENGEQRWGIALCSDEDNYSRRLGRLKAKGRAISTSDSLANFRDLTAFCYTYLHTQAVLAVDGWAGGGPRARSHRVRAQNGQGWVDVNPVAHMRSIYDRETARATARQKTSASAQA